MPEPTNSIDKEVDTKQQPEQKTNRNKPEQKREHQDITYYVRGKKQVDGKNYQRLAIQTHFVERGESYMYIIKHYVTPLYQEGDIVALGEKVISMCQDNTVEIEDVHLGFWAKFLSKFATSNEHGVGMDEPYKLQLAINMKGLPRILFASVAGGVCKLFGKRGVFYEIAGKDIAGIDGFYKASDFEIYHNLAVLTPKNPDGVCKEIETELGIVNFLSDANDFDAEILGKSPSLKDVPLDFFLNVLRDNPAGQGDELTPFVIIRQEN